MSKSLFVGGVRNLPQEFLSRGRLSAGEQLSRGFLKGNVEGALMLHAARGRAQIELQVSFCEQGVKIPGCVGLICVAIPSNRPREFETVWQSVAEVPTTHYKLQGSFWSFP